MRSRSLLPLLVPLVLAAMMAAGCDTEPASPFLNQPPNTRISAGPPEQSDTGYTVNLFWFGWDDDGFVDHYEIAWETPDEWVTPIYANDSLFAVQVSDTCCVDALPDFPSTLHDSVYEQFHTFYVRSVDNDGEADPTPAVRSFNAKTIAPWTSITFGPADNGVWGTNVEFEWAGDDDDGNVVAYRRALATKRQFYWSSNDPFTAQNFIAWLDTLQYVPVGQGEYKDSLIWEYTEIDSVVYPDVPIYDTANPENPDSPLLYLFAVRSIDDAGASERILSRLPKDPRAGRGNVARFSVSEILNGPRIAMRSNIAGAFRSGDPEETRELFAEQGIRFEWRASPGPSGSPVAGFSYAREDTAEWSPYSENSTEWPEQIEGDDEVLWYPDSGPHAFFVRVIDLGGFVNVLAARLEIFDGPRYCDPGDRFILIVLDTDSGSLEESLIFPVGYSDVERGLIDYWFNGYNYQVYQTRGQDAVPVSLMSCATSTVWLMSAAINDGDRSVLWSYHSDPPNPLPSYVASGGNMFLLGIQPVQAMRYFEKVEEPVPQIQNFPVVFQRTVTDSSFAPHWGYTRFGIARINESIGNTNTGPATDRMRKARAVVPGYPDLVFDPLTWPEGPRLRGFGYYDRDIVPVTGVAEAIYKLNDTDLTVGVRRLTAPGTNGNAIYLGLHPYFIERPAFRQLVQKILAQFGEVPGGG